MLNTHEVIQSDSLGDIQLDVDKFFDSVPVSFS